MGVNTSGNFDVNTKFQSVTTCVSHTSFQSVKVDTLMFNKNHQSLIVNKRVQLIRNSYKIFKKTFSGLVEL